MKTIIWAVAIMLGAFNSSSAQSKQSYIDNKDMTIGSDSCLLSDIRIFYASDLYVDTTFYHETRTAFLNLSEACVMDENSPYFSPEELTKDTIRIDELQKIRLLKSAGISDTDTIYIYDFGTDSVYTFCVSAFSAIACLNIYAGGSETNDFSDYEYGLNLGRSYFGTGENLVYVGKINPFQTGQLKLMEWRRVAKKKFPVKMKDSLIRENTNGYYTFENCKLGVVYKFSNEGLDYYCQEMKLIPPADSVDYGDNVSARYLVVFDSKNRKVLFEDFYCDDEWGGLTMLNIIGNSKFSAGQYGVQWTGRIFKGRSPIIYGFKEFSFGCPAIPFVDKKDRPISILCDNRH